jgi:predicted nucleotidyltransferase component of viral defense system
VSTEGVKSVAPPKRLWGHANGLDQLLEDYGGTRQIATQDFALLTLAGHLAAHFPDQLVFKGGFVLRHVHGVQRFSQDVNATRHSPTEDEQKEGQFDAAEVAQVMRGASVNEIVQFAPVWPASTDSPRSLDFERVAVSGDGVYETSVQVEISYREQVIDPPRVVQIGPPFYEEFDILAMAVPEMAAEKIRALAQRTKVTDLADLADLLQREDCSDPDIARSIEAKFRLVRRGKANRHDRIFANLEQIKADYDTTAPQYAPDAKSYQEAMEIVWPRIRSLIP